MAQLKCLCGHGMSNTSCPSSHVFHLVTDAQALDCDEALPSYVFNSTPEMWICRECGNIAISRANEPEVRWFVPYEHIDTLPWLERKQ